MEDEDEVEGAVVVMVVVAAAVVEEGLVVRIEEDRVGKIDEEE